MFSRLLLLMLRTSEQGQDLAEYCLITAFIALLGLGVFSHFTGGLQGLWGLANSTIGTAGNGAVGAAPVGH
jgi:Flp pilus assembly pilin Flp